MIKALGSCGGNIKTWVWLPARLLEKVFVLHTCQPVYAWSSVLLQQHPQHCHITQHSLPASLFSLLLGNRRDTVSAKRLLAATNPPTPITHHPALTLSAGSEAWRSMRGCNRPPPLLVVLEGVVPLLLLPLQRPGMCPAVLIGSTDPTGASSSMGATRPDMGIGPSKGP